jgi:hypothetical protein
VTHHAALFREPIVKEAVKMFERLMACLHAKQRRVSLLAPDAAAAVLVQVSAFHAFFFLCIGLIP